MSNKSRVGFAIGLALILTLSVGALATRILTVDITPYQSANVVEVTDATFEQEVLNSDVPVIINYYQTTSKSSLRFQPIFHKAADQNVGKVKFVAIDMDKNRGIVASFDIKKAPTVMFVKKGDKAGDYKIGASEGYHSAQELTDLLDLCLKPDAPLIDVKISTRKSQGQNNGTDKGGKDGKDANGADKAGKDGKDASDADKAGKDGKDASDADKAGKDGKDASDADNDTTDESQEK